MPLYPSPKPEVASATRFAGSDLIKVQSVIIENDDLNDHKLPCFGDRKWRPLKNLGHINKQFTCHNKNYAKSLLKYSKKWNLNDIFVKN